MLTALLLAFALDDRVANPTPPLEVPAPPAQTQAPADDPLSQAAAQPARPTQNPPGPIRFVWRDHPSLRGRNFRVDFAAKVQQDSRDPGDQPADFPTWELHRLRAGIEGELFQKIQFSIEREFSETEINDPRDLSPKTQWKDVYIEGNFANPFQIRFGLFKVPYGLDQTSGESELDFVYRSGGGNYLSPGRDVGVMAHGRFFDRGLNYWVGVFRQDGDNSRSRRVEGADRTIAARLTFLPLRRLGDALEDAEIGVSYATSELSDESVLPNGLRARTPMSQFTFFEPVFVKGTRQRYGADIDWAAGPFGARAEYMFVADTRQDQGLGDQDLSDARGRAYYVLGTWVVTGERKRRPVEAREGGLGRGGFGALELVLRFDRLWFDSPIGLDTPFRNSRAETILPSGDKVFTGGFTYYANRFVKIQFNAIREQLEDAERSPVLGGAAFWSTVLRFQFQL